MKMFTINGLAAHFKAEDPNTPITPFAIRQLVRSGAIRSAMVGRKHLVSLEAAEAYFSGATTGTQNQPAPEIGTIRPIPERPTR